MKNWKKILGAVAPTVATALGGPLAGLAVREIAGKVLGNPDASEADVAAAITSASPETLLKLKELELGFTQRMAELGIELEKLEAEDRASARRREVETRDWTPRVLGLLIFVAFSSVQVFLLVRDVPEGTRELLTRTLGTLDAMVITVLAYYFGSSRGSRNKEEIIGKVVTNK